MLNYSKYTYRKATTFISLIYNENVTKRRWAYLINPGINPLLFHHTSVISDTYI